MTNPPSPAIALLGFAVVLLAAAGCGMTLLRLLRADTDSGDERFVMGSALGLGLLAYAVLTVGLLGWLYPQVLVGLVLLQAVVGAKALLDWSRSLLVRSASHHDASPDRPHSLLARLRAPGIGRTEAGVAAALILLCLFLVTVTLVGALAPPNGDDWDSLAYHLAAPKIYLSHHRIAFIPYDSHTNFPFTLEMLYAVGLSYGGAAGAKLFHWACGWLTALSIAAFCRRLFPLESPAGMPPGVQAAMPLWGPPLAAALFLSIPQVQWQATTAYIDLGTTFFQFLALAAFVYAVSGVPGTREAGGFRRSGVQEGLAVPGSAGPGPGPRRWPLARPKRGSPAPASDHAGGTPALPEGPPERLNTHPSPGGWFLMSGLMSGWAMGTKMTALIPFGLLVLAAGVWAALGVRRAGAAAAKSQQGARAAGNATKNGSRWACVAALVLAGVLVACPWYVKSYLWTNNPVYPFFYHLFPHSVGWTQQAEDAYRMEQGRFGLGKGPLDLLMAPWNLAMNGWAYFTIPSRQAPSGSLLYFDGLRRGGLSAIFLGLVPLALLVRQWDRRLSGLVLYALAMLPPWFLLSQQSRYLLPVAAPLSVVAAAVVANLEVDLPRWAAGTFAGLVLLIHGAWGWSFLFARALPVVSGQISQDQYLRRTFSPYAASSYINSRPPGTRVAFYQETRGFYLDRDYLWANPLQNTLVPYDSLKGGKELVRFLKHPLGVTHVLVNINGLEGSESSNWYLLLKDAIDHGELVPVFAERGVVVYAIPDS